MTLDAILAEVTEADLPIVEVTGGEPLLQKAVYPLMEALLERDRPVLLETSGAVSIKDVPPGVYKIVDMKAPGSGEVAQNHYENLDLVQPHDEVKFVIADRPDYEWSAEITRKHALAGRVQAVTFSPVHGELDAADLAQWLVEDHLPVRLGMQMHKFIWPGIEKGV